DSTEASLYRDTPASPRQDQHTISTLAALCAIARRTLAGQGALPQPFRDLLIPTVTELLELGEAAWPTARATLTEDERVDWAARWVLSNDYHANDDWHAERLAGPQRWMLSRSWVF